MHMCELGWDRFAVLVPPGCYLNHSCDPNAMRSGVKVFAWKPIRAGEEITIDYRLNAFDGDTWPCSAQAPTARVKSSEASSRFPSSVSGRILRYAPTFIQREYRRRQRRRMNWLRLRTYRLLSASVTLNR